MTLVTVDEHKHQSDYQALKRARTRITWMLSAAIVVVHLAIILLIAITAGLLGDLSEAEVTFIGIALGLGVIVFCFIVTAIYVYYANHVLEPLTRAAEQKMDQES